ncbi:MAG: hypothetical protein K2Q01_08030, partial [Rickettsiales bacterium]|nr:hypothetical protein [Rickettsiales bacterium]
MSARIGFLSIIVAGLFALPAYAQNLAQGPDSADASPALPPANVLESASPPAEVAVPTPAPAPAPAPKKTKKSKKTKAENIADAETGEPKVDALS